MGVVSVDRGTSHPEQLRVLLEDLKAITHEKTFQRTLMIGQLMLERLFGGSAQLWHDRRRNKLNSVRRLADMPECSMSRSALSQAISVYVAVQRLPRVRSFENIGASHVASVLSLPALEQEQWLWLANGQHWSVRRLHHEIRNQRRLGALAADSRAASLSEGHTVGLPRPANPRRKLKSIRSAARALERAVGALGSVDLAMALEREWAEELVQVAVRISKAQSSLISRLSSTPEQK